MVRTSLMKMQSLVITPDCSSTSSLKPWFQQVKWETQEQTSLSRMQLPEAEVEAIARKSSIKPGTLAGLMILTAVVGAALVGGAWLYMAKFRSTEAQNTQYHTSDGDSSQVHNRLSELKHTIS